jgi:hypothetical protein
VVAVAALGAWGLSATPAWATTIKVTPGAVDNVINQNCSLVEAVIAANTDLPRDKCPAGSDTDTIDAPGVFVLKTAYISTDTSVDPAEGFNGLPAIRKQITINNAVISRAADAESFRIVRVADMGNLTLANTTVSGGRAADCPNDIRVGVCAGGILNNSTLRLLNSRVIGNIATGSGSLFIGGAGITNAGTATLTNSIVSDNATTGDLAAGGGITNNLSHTLTVVDSQIYGNETTSTGTIATGGGIANFGTASLTNSRLLANTIRATGGIAAGGGVYNEQGATANLTNSQVIGNRATGGTARGGGIYTENATTTLTNSQVIDNRPDNCEPPIPSNTSPGGTCGLTPAG